MSCSRAAQGRGPGLPSVHHCRQATALGHSLATLSEAPSLGPPARLRPKPFPAASGPTQAVRGGSRGGRSAGPRPAVTARWRSWGREGGRGSFPAVSVL